MTVQSKSAIKKVFHLLLVTLGYNLLKPIVLWYIRLRHLKAQSHIAPVAAEFSATPWAMLVNLKANSSRLLDYRSNVYKKYQTGAQKHAKSVTGCGLMFGGAPLVFTTDENVLRHILKNNINNYFRIDFGFDKVFGKSLLTVDHGPLSKDKGAYFNYERRTATKTFTENNLDKMIRSSGIHHTKILLQDISDHIASGSQAGFPLKQHVSALTFSIMCEVGFGYRFESIEERKKYEDAFEMIIELLPQEYLNLGWKLPFAEKFIESKKTMVAVTKLFVELCYKIIDVRISEDDETRANRGDLLSLFMNSSKDNQYSRTQLRDLVMLFLTAGRDTSGALMAWLGLELARAPHVQEEIYNQTKEYLNIDPVTNEVTYERTKVKENLYLDGVCLEGLRLHPPIVFQGKVAQRDDVLPNGLHIKAGTTIFSDNYAMGHDERRYKDPETFNPTRWTDPSRKTEIFDEFNLPVFGGGKRSCVGKKLALHEVKLYVCALVHKFKFQLHPDELKFVRESEVLYGSGQSGTYKGELLINVVNR